ncbi:PilZ domain-containing protein [Sphingomonas sp.]|uniref:PilZ domain-containing protein n=1 Tax=Sphingomonas sp. TaxID=28214 RepID=UPI0025E9B3BF|nr:PilZ domain-containing protein [Sphingomonas sp.]MBV9528538.1 PilZ domain-containing protein [Sphingomonas sp.]
MNMFGKRSGGGRRKAQREPAPTTAVFTTVTQSHGAILVDLSATGARLRSSDLPAMGEELMLAVEAIRAFGSVAWVRGDQFGMAFDDPISPLDVVQLRARLRRTAGLAPETSAAMDDWTTGLAR